MEYGGKWGTAEVCPLFKEEVSKQKITGVLIYWYCLLAKLYSKLINASIQTITEIKLRDLVDSGKDVSVLTMFSL